MPTADHPHETQHAGVAGGFPDAPLPFLVIGLAADADGVT
jgi:hypothetical protein